MRVQALRAQIRSSPVEVQSMDKSGSLKTTMKRAMKSKRSKSI